MAYRKIPSVTGYKRQEIIAFLKIQLRTNIVYAYHALKRLYELQTEKEKKQLYSQGHNNVGFNKVDSLILTIIYQNSKKRGFLTEKEKKSLKNKIPKYSIQIASISDPIKLKIAMDEWYGKYKDNIHPDLF